MRLAIALYALGLLAFPVWGLLSPESYRAELDDFEQALAATTDQLQMAAGLHWLKNAYLAFIFLLLARYVGRPERPADVKRAGALLIALPIVLLIYQVLVQVAMSPDVDDLDLKLHLRSEWLLYATLGLSLIGIARTLATTNREEPAT